VRSPSFGSRLASPPEKKDDTRVSLPFWCVAPKRTKKESIKSLAEKKAKQVSKEAASLSLGTTLVLGKLVKREVGGKEEFL
jgi:hypothetical protein